MRGSKIEAALNLLSRLWHNAEGGMGITAAISLPVLVGASVIAIELSSINSTRNRMQGMVDQAVIAAAKELRLGNATEDTILNVARNHIAASVPALNLPYEFSGQVANDRKSINISIQATLTPGIGAAAGLAPTSITASATAKVMGGAPLCAIGLDRSAASTILLDKQARIQAPGCTIYSNSSASNGIDAKNGAVATAASICTAGGFAGSSASFSPAPQTDCPALADPLSGRPPPAYGNCESDKQNLTLSGSDTFLTPGVYCGGINVKKDIIVTFQPGIYIIKDGPIDMDKNVRLVGTGVSLYFTGANAGMSLKKDTSISLTAPETGPMAGILMYQDRNNPTDNVQFEISSDDASTLLGTIYLPRGYLYLGGDKPVAQSSAYTIVVANKIIASAGPTLVLNSNYSSTTVPVPSGVGPSASQVMLQR